MTLLQTPEEPKPSEKDLTKQDKQKVLKHIFKIVPLSADMEHELLAQIKPCYTEEQVKKDLKNNKDIPVVICTYEVDGSKPNIQGQISIEALKLLAQAIEPFDLSIAVTSVNSHKPYLRRSVGQIYRATLDRLATESDNNITSIEDSRDQIYPNKVPNMKTPFLYPNPYEILSTYEEIFKLVELIESKEFNDKGVIIASTPHIPRIRAMIKELFPKYEGRIIVLSSEALIISMGNHENLEMLRSDKYIEEMTHFALSERDGLSARIKKHLRFSTILAHVIPSIKNQILRKTAV